ncbi:MAG: glycosyltransferase family A protein, partial [Candidatus Staskawiczbacteria bacterium]
MSNWINDNYKPGLVSVVVPTYNRAELICETLNSVRSQSYRPIELLIIDDGSTDNTEQIINNWKKYHPDDLLFSTVYFKCPHDGPSAARNLGTSKSNGEFINYLDSDDILNKFKIDNQIKQSLLSNTTTYGSGQRFAADTEGIALYTIVLAPRPERALKDWFEGRFALSCSFLWRRKDIQYNGPWRENLDDGEFARRFLLKGGQWSFCSNAWSYYRIYT